MARKNYPEVKQKSEKIDQELINYIQVIIIFSIYKHLF